MATPLVPVTKAIYCCDNVVEDQSSGKIHVLGVFNAIRPPYGTAYPCRLRQLCVFTQLIGGIGEVSLRLEVVSARDETIVYTSAEQRVRFPDRHTTMSACFRILECPFPRPGVYLVELYAQGVFLDDRALHLLV